MQVKQEYPINLRRGDIVVAENRAYTVHSVDSWIEQRFPPFHNRVGVETTTGCYLTFPISATVETHCR